MKVAIRKGVLSLVPVLSSEAPGKKTITANEGRSQNTPCACDLAFLLDLLHAVAPTHALAPRRSVLGSCAGSPGWLGGRRDGAPAAFLLQVFAETRPRWLAMEAVRPTAPPGDQLDRRNLPLLVPI
jgi:hypothetical protein